MKKALLIFFTFSVVQFCFSQNKIWLGDRAEWVSDSTHASRYAIVRKEKEKKIRVEEYTVAGKKQCIEYYSKYTSDPQERIREGLSTEVYSNGKDSLVATFRKNRIEGSCTIYYPDGSIHILSNYKKGQLYGDFTQHYPSGKLKREELYKEGYCIGGKLYAENGTELEHEPYTVMPEFPGGQERLMTIVSQTLKYPQEAGQNKIEGRVLIQFYIDTEGYMTSPVFVERSHPLLNMEATRTFYKIASAYRWKAGRQDGKAIRTKFTLPIIFRLSQKTF